MANAPRMVLVTRPTDYQLLLARHGTRGQAEFFLNNRGQSIEEVEAFDVRFHEALLTVQRSVPASWRSTSVGRHDLDRFVFEPEDVVIALGQDGLVANLAKYLDGQAVIGLNPDPGRFDGVLVRYAPEDTTELLAVSQAGTARTQARTMVQATLNDGQVLWALNEIFIGHASHQSA
ncbi:MAG: hypothetical protein OES38_01440, partial [Gammaproteobacteria bacterium]|nr:hypothetical protein [Gammaproteobacteria bacterium]